MRMENKWGMLGVVLLWVLFAALMLDNRQPGILAVAFVLAAYNTYINLNRTAHGKYQRRKNKNERIIAKRFGRWTPFVMYGSIGILAGLGLLFDRCPSPVTFQLFGGWLIVFLILGLYLCYLVAAGKNDPDIQDPPEEDQ